MDVKETKSSCTFAAGTSYAIKVSFAADRDFGSEYLLQWCISSHYSKYMCFDDNTEMLSGSNGSTYVLSRTWNVASDISSDTDAWMLLNIRNG